MRNLFIVLVKVVGLFQIPYVLNYLYMLNIDLVQIVSSDNWSEEFGNRFVMLSGTCVGMGLVLGLAWVFLFRTTWIADRLRIPEVEINWPEMNSLLYVGIKLLGLSVLIGAIPGFISVMFNPRAFNPDTSASHFWVRILPTALKFVFGLILVGKTKSVIELISGDARPKEPQSA